MLDANVLVSAFITPEGVAGRIFDAWKWKQFILVLSPYILDEVERILIEKIELVRSFVEEQIDLFYEIAEVVYPLDVVDVKISENDRPVLGTAVAGYAETLVTGDKELLALVEYRGISIITPRGFIDRI